MLQSNKKQLCFGIEEKERSRRLRVKRTRKGYKTGKKQNMIRGQRREKGRGGGSKDLFLPTRKSLSVPLAVHECRCPERENL